VPLDSTPTTHILKPGISGFSHHELNEYLTQRAARALGISAATTELTDGGDAGPVLVSTRFDRIRRNGRLRRLHQEDMCQALSVLPENKYQKDGGPGLAQIADLLINTAPIEKRARSQRGMFDAITFNVAIAGTDAHAKNFALLLGSDGQELAPLYDMASALPYEKRLTERGPLLAPMRVDGEDRFSAIGRAQLLAAARRFGLPVEEADHRIEEILTGVSDAYFTSADAIEDKELRGVGQSIATSIRAWSQRRGWTPTDPTTID
jgi:serine/threonine-protein kinase HipA